MLFLYGLLFHCIVQITFNCLYVRHIQYKYKFASHCLKRRTEKEESAKFSIYLYSAGVRVSVLHTL